MLTNRDIAELISFRRDLHRAPELSGAEVATAAAVQRFLAGGPDHVIAGLGGTGLAAVYDGAAPGPTVLLRAELDALPITEQSTAAHRSAVPGTAHLCGHDGHMAILCGMGRLLQRARPPRGRVVLLFQPAEETGAGAAAVLDDPRFADLAPDAALALHNLPGLPLGHAALISGPACCASRGLRLALEGRTAHASMPETGRSPMRAVAELMPALTALGPGGALEPGFRLVTVTHAHMGEPTYGVAPGSAVVQATLRCLEDGAMAALCDDALQVAGRLAARDGLVLSHSWHDVFHACTNDAALTAMLDEVCADAGIARVPPPGPMRFSEDFGRFGAVAPCTLALLGSGEDHPQLHNPDYDFPDDLIAIGVRLFDGAVQRLLAPA